MNVSVGDGYQPGIPPGWYPDPSGDYELRWFDGVRWADAVVTGQFRTHDPIAPPAPLDAVERALWSHGKDELTTHHITFGTMDPARPPQRFEVWMVASVATRSGIDFGDVAVSIGYPGYVGRVTWVLRDVASAGAVAAMVRKRANQVRRALGRA